MKKIRKVLALTLCAIALVGASVMGTMAYLTDNDTVTNTFTVGNIDIMLDEAKVDEYGHAVDNSNDPIKEGGAYIVPDAVDDNTNVVRVESNSYKLLPGHTYIKDPTVTVVAGSEDAYVRMLVEVNDIGKLKEAFPKSKYDTWYNGEVFLLQKLVGGWNNAVWVSTEEVKTATVSGVTSATYEFRYVGNDTGNPGNGIVVKNNAATVLPDLFTHIIVPSELNNAEIAKLNEVEITVKAHAIQADGFANADEAWDKFDINAPAYDTPVTP